MQSELKVKRFATSLAVDAVFYCALILDVYLGQVLQVGFFETFKFYIFLLFF